LVAQAGPCGLWPDDLGPSYDPGTFKIGSTTTSAARNQRNLAAMVANPSDLVQPRAETPAYTAKRSTRAQRAAT
jgi:pilus assembly protein CpaD